MCPESGLEVSVPFIAPDIGMRDVPHLGHLINELELIGEGATGQVREFSLFFTKKKRTREFKIKQEVFPLSL